MRYHLWVNNEGRVLLLQAEHADTSRGEPWAPITYMTVLQWAHLLDDIDTPMSIHTSTL